MKPDSIGFDLDGTLWSTLIPVTEAWIKTAEEFGVRQCTEEEISGVFGLNRIDLMNKLYPEMDSEMQMKFFKRATEICDGTLKLHGAVLYSQVEETIKKLSRKYSLYIVSNCQDGYIEAFLKFFDFQKYFCDFAHPDERCLPKGTIIKELMNKNGFRSSVYAGDTQGDADAAELAGIPFIFAEYGFGNTDKYDYKISSFSDILDIVE